MKETFPFKSNYSDVNLSKLKPELAHKPLRQTFVFLLSFSAGRRQDGNISLERVLKFVTGSENEPVLGFQMRPTIVFKAAVRSCVPMSNTCINRLTLPVGEIVPDVKEEVFSFFDYAFINDYFGCL